MSPATYHSSACAAKQRHKHHRPSRRPTSGQLGTTSREVVARLLDEGVPAADLDVVAAELRRCLDLDHGALNGGSSWITVSPWAAEILARYRDKTRVVFLTTRGRVEHA